MRKIKIKVTDEQETQEIMTILLPLDMASGILEQMGKHLYDLCCRPSAVESARAILDVSADPTSTTVENQ
ncbi:MAG: hypothetical protein PHI12_11345 [Dehalococcoidales bacterium]|nr:hypothetical protein [Dehalococcoidales bacterium]